jgi:hypothetical protein
MEGYPADGLLTFETGLSIPALRIYDLTLPRYTPRRDLSGLVIVNNPIMAYGG